MYAFGVTAILIEPGFHRTHLTSRDNIGAWVKKTWERVSPEVREEYGEEYFLKCELFKVHAYMNIGSNAAGLGGPFACANLVYRLLNERLDRWRYIQ